jgi:hypothetical protein
MTNQNTPVDGPFRITVEPLPTGVTLDVETFVQHVVHGVIEALLRDDAFADRLGALYEAQARDPHLVERPGDLPVESLVADLVAVVGTKMPVYGLQAFRLAGRIEQLAAPAVAAETADLVESALRTLRGGAAA